MPLPLRSPACGSCHRENGGLAAARNTGLQAAQGDWLLLFGQ